MLSRNKVRTLDLGRTYLKLIVPGLRVGVVGDDQELFS